MTKAYYTLIVWTPGEDESDPGCWSDEFGSYSRREVEEERDIILTHHKRGHTAIIKHEESTGAMIAARDSYPPPKR